MRSGVGQSAISVRDDLPYKGRRECNDVQGKEERTGYWHSILLNIILLFTIQNLDIEFFLVQV